MNNKILSRIAILLTAITMLCTALVGCAEIDIDDDVIDSIGEIIDQIDQTEPTGENGEQVTEPPTAFADPTGTTSISDGSATPDKDGQYTTKDDVVAYIRAYGCLPSNFITKQQAKSLGWSGGGLDKYAYGKSIGGDRFGNYEGQLPDEKGRKWTECDINTMHANSRGAERVVFSNDGLIYYTPDHYDHFYLCEP